MKKTYLQPTMMVVTLQQQGIICTSPVSRVSSNLDEGETLTIDDDTPASFWGR